jgi:hypothetical protein
MATAGKDELGAALAKPKERTIGLGNLPGGKAKGGATRYALAVFGKPLRLTNCDCERNSSPSLSQTIFLRNDREIFGMIDRETGWLRETGKALGPAFTSQAEPSKAADSRLGERIDGLIEESFLRTLSREPSHAELADARRTFDESESPSAALRNLLWALLNTKEFIVNR